MTFEQHTKIWDMPKFFLSILILKILLYALTRARQQETGDYLSRQSFAVTLH